MKEVSFANDNIDTMMKPPACDIVLFNKDDMPSDLWKIRNEVNAANLVEELVRPITPSPAAWRPFRLRAKTPINVPKKLKPKGC